MQEGSLRCDVNVSVRPEGQEQLGTKVEIKNMNSFSAMQQAIEFEVARQSDLLRQGTPEAIVQETRLFDEATQVPPTRTRTFQNVSDSPCDRVPLHRRHVVAAA